MASAKAADAKRIDAKELFSAWWNDALFQQALRHRSAGDPHNERLEFIGDAALDLIIGRRLYAAFPDLSEGDLTRMRSHLVRDESLSAIARAIDLGDYLVLGRGEAKDGRKKTSILAGAFEAMLGAVYLVAGLDAVDEVVARAFGERIENVSGDLRDAKTRLQEHLQAKGLALPEYIVEPVNDGAAFEARCVVGECSATGRGESKKAAEQLAAERMLALLARTR